MFEIDIDPRSMRTFKALQNSFLMIAAIERGINKGFIETGRELVRQGRDSILHDRKTGTIYKVPNSKRGVVGKTWHQASSADGSETPANYTSDLAKGLHYVSHYTQLEWGYDASTPYGKFLEEGSPGGKIKPRPLLQRFSNGISALAEGYFEHEINHALHRIF